MSQIHGYLHHPKYSQDFKSVDCNWVPNHELISHYQVLPFWTRGTSQSCVYIALHLPARIKIITIPFICMRLTYNSHVKTIIDIKYPFNTHHYAYNFYNDIHEIFYFLDMCLNMQKFIFKILVDLFPIMLYLIVNIIR